MVVGCLQPSGAAESIFRKLVVTLSSLQAPGGWDSSSLEEVAPLLVDEFCRRDGWRWTPSSRMKRRSSPRQRRVLSFELRAEGTRHARNWCGTTFVQRPAAPDVYQSSSGEGTSIFAIPEVIESDVSKNSADVTLVEDVVDTLAPVRPPIFQKEMNPAFLARGRVHNAHRDECRD